MVYQFKFPEPLSDEEAREISRRTLTREPEPPPARYSLLHVIRAGRALCEDTDEELALYL